MAKLQHSLSSELQYDGKPGFLVVQSGILQAAASLVRGNVFIPPCPMTIIAARMNIITSYTHASTLFSIGTLADSGHDNIMTWDNEDLAAGDYDINSLGTWTTRALAAGVPVVVGCLAATDTTGLGAAYIVCEPTEA